MASREEKALHCSFCGKSVEIVTKLIAGPEDTIAGPKVFICNECVVLCNEIIEDEVIEGGNKSSAWILFADLHAALGCMTLSQMRAQISTIDLPDSSENAASWFIRVIKLFSAKTYEHRLKETKAEEINETLRIQRENAARLQAELTTVQADIAEKEAELQAI